MHREHHRWHSPSLNRPMEMLVFGHAGARVIVFPTSKGRFYEWEDRNMMGALSEQINRGWLQLYCVDSVDAESWYNYGAHPGARAYRHHQYMDYVRHEVVPLSQSKNGNPFLMTMGASFGAFHAASFAVRYPDMVDRMLAFSGLFDIRSFTDGYSDPYVYQYNPMECVPMEWDERRLAQLRHVDFILATGRDDRLIHSARAFSGALWGKGIGNAMREWDGWSHDWQYWTKMMQMYINGHD
jgi:esterase/lipase superfamily enzyme